MPTADDERLNSLRRYEKRSAHLALLACSHCEVPAGCGGAVLRWLDPRTEFPFLLRLHANTACGVRLDGNDLFSSRITLAPGPHVLAFLLSPTEVGEVSFLFAAIRDRLAPGTSALSAIRSGPVVADHVCRSRR